MPKPQKQNQPNTAVPFVDRPSFRQSRFVLGGALLIASLAVLAYQPAFHGDFIWDDELYLTKCDLIKAPDGLYRFWFTTQPIDYWPASNSTLWLEWRLWGMNPTGYHITNLALHIAVALLMWRILRVLSVGGAFLAALLFAVHPVNVESVAWIAQRKGLLATLFFLLSILCYVREEIAQRRTEGEPGEEEAGRHFGFAAVGRWYWISLLAFLLAMLSKGSVAMLPLVLLLIVWWQWGRITVGDVWRTTPFILVGVVLAGVNVWFQTHGRDEVIRSANFAQRLAGSGEVIWFYLSKALAPIELSFVYPQWEIQTGVVWWWLPLLAAAAVTIVLWRRCDSPQTNWCRPLLLAWIFFCLTLVPVLGFTDVYFMKYSFVADHYQYLGLLGAMALVAAGWNLWRQQSQTTVRATANVTAAIVVGTFVLLSRQQSQTFQDAMTLYQSTLLKNPTSWLAYNNLGVEEHKRGQQREAIEHYQQSLRLRPDNAEAYNNLGVALVADGQLDEAIHQYQESIRYRPLNPDALDNLGVALSLLGQTKKALQCFATSLQIRPNSAATYNNLGYALVRAGRPQEAMKHFEQALQIEPEFPDAQNNWGEALNKTNQPQEAIEHLQEALRLKPNFPEAHNNLGDALKQTGQLPAAIEQYQQAVQQKPDFLEALSSLGLALVSIGRPQEAIKYYEQAQQIKPDAAEAHNNLGTALKQSGQLPAAIEQYQQALRAKPDFVEAHYNLANALAMKGQTAEAIEQYQEAIRLKPDLAEAHNNLAAALLKAGRPEEAIAQFQQVLKLKPQDATIYANLAIIYAQLKRTEDATAAAQKALDMARSQGQTALAEQIEKWLKSFRAEQNKAGEVAPSSQAAPVRP